jgi:hypothetical protein
MARKARPTLRCLREDLGQAIPRADTPLDEIEHPLLVKAAEQFANDETPHERIAAIDDRVLFKVKVQRSGMNAACASSCAPSSASRCWTGENMLRCSMALPWASKSSPTRDTPPMSQSGLSDRFPAI